MSSQATEVKAAETLEAVQVGSTVLRRRNRIETWLFLIPAFLFQLVWGWYPLVVAFLISFTDAQPILPSTYTGLESYIRVWNDPLVAQSFRVTFIYAGLTIALMILHRYRLQQ
jgi:multiple sugar transport system permease protein